ncbi:hypothetical protein F4679DRAFT_533467 [Xylaria curta]|nr:hypothetical protein F4679DRAFT_533467 [Xylaria curta]
MQPLTSDFEPALSKQHFTALPSREESRMIAQKHFKEYFGQPIEDKPFDIRDTEYLQRGLHVHFKLPSSMHAWVLAVVRCGHWN